MLLDTHMVVTWRGCGLRPRDEDTPSHILSPGSICSELPRADLVLKQHDLQSACPYFVVQDSRVEVGEITQIPDGLYCL